MKLFLKVLKYLLLVLIIGLVAILLFFYKSDLPLESLKPKYTNVDSRFMTVLGADVHYQDVGPKTDTLPIVLIHGTGASLHTWSSWVYALKTQKRVITLDLPAYGLTGPNASHNYTSDMYVKTLDSLLINLNINKFILGGNSLGGQVSWSYAVEHPEKVSKLILVDAAGYKFNSSSVPVAFKLARIPVLNNLIRFITPRFIIEKSVQNVYADPSKVTNSLVDRYYDLTLRAGNRQAFVDRIYEPQNTLVVDDISENLKKLNMPTLILWGAEDGLIPVASAHKFHDDLPNDTLVILDKLGHVPMEEDPAKSLAVVKSFLGLK